MDKKLILGFVDNLMFTSRIESVVENAGYAIEWMAVSMGQEKPPLAKIIQQAPALILIDLEMGNISWDAWIEEIKSQSSLGDLPILCFGSHKDVDAFTKARRAGADRVVARSKFFSSMPDLFRRLIL